MASPSQPGHMRSPDIDMAAILERHRQSVPDESYASDGDGGDEEMAHQEGDSQSPFARLLDEARTYSTKDRLRLMEELSRTLPTSDIVQFYDRLADRIFFDPLLYLPYELTFEVFSHLTPNDLLNCSLVSRTWRSQSYNERLWRDCFSKEGWDMDTPRFRALETVAKNHSPAEAIKRMHNVQLHLHRRESRKRPRDEAFSDAGSTMGQPGSVRGRDDSDESDGMDGVETSMENNVPHHPAEVTARIPLFTAGNDPKISWPWLYKQRRRLERNWDKGKYTMFRLPDAQFESEGHTECVYTIQHIGDTLVSGSRDKTIRIWDLTSCRLKGAPLVGHDASVLCLQFDNSPSEDIIISGGSDNYIIVWKFSTGEIIKRMVNAHEESVLNLRFDNRYLVTCSKDKTIKIWNRHEISNTDPIIPVRIMDQFAGMSPIPAFSLIDTLGVSSFRHSHNAAVNAVQIHGDTIVSASGDRTVKAWNIHTGQVEKTYHGHVKGIACVQFDGRRVVSGSSDNTVRIFDATTSGEIACLDGHTNLVRTVQARFGDLRITSDEELHTESRKVDKIWDQAYRAGKIERRQVSRRGPGRNAGSSDPNRILSVGNKLPPGGGGSVWARIVSGSYDEHVIIWKQDREVGWKPNIRLHQGTLFQNRMVPIRTPNPGPQPGDLDYALNGPQTREQTLQRAQALAQRQPQQQQQLPVQPPVQGRSQARAAVVQQPPQERGAGEGSSRAPLLHPAFQPQTQQQQPHASTSTITNNDALPEHANGVQAAGAAAAANANPPPPQQQHHHHHHGAGHNHHHHHHPHAAAARGDSFRVFKLQFDCRRIIACSQNRVISGWDFAAGDKDLELVGDWSSETA